MNWTEYKKNEKHEEKNKTLIEIIKSIEKIKPDLFNSESRTLKTQIVKIALVKLGHKLGFKAYANRLTKEQVKYIGNGFVNREWLFDLHWYSENGNYKVTNTQLACECEWGIKRKFDKITNYSSMKYDFQKLLVTKCSLKLMIFSLANIKDIEDLNEYFLDTINNYKSLPRNSEFLLVAVNHKMKTIIYKTHIK